MSTQRSEGASGSCRTPGYHPACTEESSRGIPILRPFILKCSSRLEMANRRGVQLGRAGRGCFGHTAISRRRHDHSTFDDPRNSVAKSVYPARLASALRCRPSTHRPNDPNCRVRRPYRPRKDECDLARSRNVRQRNHCMFAMPHATARVRSDLPGSFAGISRRRLSRGLASRPQVWGDAADVSDMEVL